MSAAIQHAIAGLYAITDGSLLHGRLLDAVEQALQGGARIVQYRDKSTDSARRHDEAAALRSLCQAQGVPLLINDDVDLAAAIGADGVHLGQGDTALAEARHRLGADAIIGITCHDQLDLAAAATAGGASYLAFGAMFASSSKPLARPCPLTTLTAARRFGLPLVAIGGITPDNAGQVIAAGANALAVIAGLWKAPDIRQRARQFAQEFSST